MQAKQVDIDRREREALEVEECSTTIMQMTFLRGKEKNIDTCNLSLDEWEEFWGV